MRYLRKWNESVENVSDEIQTIKDILLPISDMGYEISVTEYRSELSIRVVRYTDPPLMMNDEVKEEFIRMNDYLEYLGINSVKALYVREGSNYQFEEDFNEFIILEEVELKNILFVVK
jgi:hypothetical protein